MDELNKNLEPTTPAPEPAMPEVEPVAVQTESPVTNEPEMTVASDVAASAAEAQPKNKNLLYTIGAVIVALLLIGGVYYFVSMRNADGGPVAVVNGFKIARDEFNSSVEMIKQAAMLQGANIDDPEVTSAINQQALDILVNNSLLIEAAKSAGITVEDSQIDEEYNNLVTELGGEENLKARMEEVDLTEKKLRDNIRERILVDAYIEAQTDIESVSATDEEVQALYDSVAGMSSTTPPLEDIRPQVVEQILGQKRQTIVNDLLMKLREEAEIEITL